MNVTSFENVSVLENARPRRGNPPWPDGFNTMAPSPQVTVYETVIELENVTSQENVTTLINETDASILQLTPRDAPTQRDYDYVHPRITRVAASNRSRSFATALRSTTSSTTSTPVPAADHPQRDRERDRGCHHDRERDHDAQRARTSPRRGPRARRVAVSDSEQGINSMAPP